MQNVIIVSGVSPAIRVFRTEDKAAADSAAQYIENMFPHLRGGLVSVVSADHWQVQESMPASGFLRDSAQAYLTTGNGFPRPHNVTMES